MAKQGKTKIPEGVTRVRNAVTGETKELKPKNPLSKCPNCNQEALIVVGGGQGCMMCSHTFAYTQ